MPYVDKHAAAVQAAIVMDFWKRPKFWGAFILVAWVLYVVYANFQLSPVEIHLLPKLVSLQFRVSALIIMSAIFGAVATLWAQWLWRRRSSKNAAESTAAAASSSKTVA
jgi:heme/copper-type cytochrome/quinol oxidase subunit 2